MSRGRLMPEYDGDRNGVVDSAEVKIRYGDDDLVVDTSDPAPNTTPGARTRMSSSSVLSGSADQLFLEVHAAASVSRSERMSVRRELTGLGPTAQVGLQTWALAPVVSYRRVAGSTWAIQLLAADPNGSSRP